MGPASWSSHPLDPVPEIQRLPQRVWENLTRWRKKWSEIWFVYVDGRPYVFRSPTRGEAIRHDMNAMVAPAQADDSFVHDCLLHPTELPDKMSLVSFDVLHRAIWKASGYRDNEVFLERLAQLEQFIGSPDQVYVMILVKAFPGLLPDTINSWQPEKLLYHLALAKAILELPPEQPGKKRRRRMPHDQMPDGMPHGPEPTSAAAPRPPREPLDWEAERAEYDAFLQE